VTDGLVLCLDAANSRSYPGSGTACYDLSNRVAAGVLQNGTTFSSSNLGSFVFDGTNDRIQIDSPFGDIDWAGRAWSLSLWSKWDAFGDRGMINLNSANNTHYCLNMICGYGGFYWYFIQNSTTNQAPFFTSSSPVAVNQIFNFTMTYNGNGVFPALSNVSNIRFYIDGNLVSTTVGGGATITNQSGIQLGGTNYAFDGNLYHVSMYNRVLAEQDVRQNFNAIRGRFGI
jgi:hypothetical protein